MSHVLRGCYEAVADLSCVSLARSAYEEVSDVLRTCYEEVTRKLRAAVEFGRYSTYVGMVSEAAVRPPASDALLKSVARVGLVLC